MALFYDSWLEGIYGRTEAQKFWNHMKTLDGLQDALDVVVGFWDPADLVNVGISFCRKDWGNFWVNLVCAIPLLGSLLGKGWKWLKSAGANMVVKGINKGDDLVSSLKVTYKVTADMAASAQRYLDDVFEQMRAGRIGNGKYQYGFAGGYMDESSLFIYEFTYNGELHKVAVTVGNNGFVVGANPK